MNIEKLTPSQLAIIHELSRTFDRLGAERGIFAALHSWGDTLPESEVLKMLQEMNQNCIETMNNTDVIITNTMLTIEQRNNPDNQMTAVLTKEQAARIIKALSE